MDVRGPGGGSPNPGDYLLLDVVRASSWHAPGRKLAAHYNVCRHRGSLLVLGVDPKPRRWAEKATGDKLTFGPSGSFTSGIMSYHSWTYELSGAPDRTIPRRRLGFHKDQLPLYPESGWWGGFVPETGYRDSGGKARPRVATGWRGRSDQTLPAGGAAHRPADRIRGGGELESHSRELQRVLSLRRVHPELCKVVPAFKQKGGMDLDWDRGVPHREGAWTFTMSGTTNRKPFAGLNKTSRPATRVSCCIPTSAEPLGRARAAAFTLWPTSPNHTTILCDFLFHPRKSRSPISIPTMRWSSGTSPTGRTG
jgi:Rieske 2Fe-2S family protein